MKTPYVNRRRGEQVFDRWPVGCRRRAGGGAAAISQRMIVLN
jgi:hypothetical protein